MKHNGIEVMADMDVVPAADNDMDCGTANAGTSMAETMAAWESAVPECIRQDAVWRLSAYRMSLFASDMAWQDLGITRGQRQWHTAADQLVRACGSISANVEEGFSRSSQKERAHFYEYALGSARETRGWYYKARHLFDPAILSARLEWLSQICKLLLTMVADQRGWIAKETAVEGASYDPHN